MPWQPSRCVLVVTELPMSGQWGGGYLIPSLEGGTPSYWWGGGVPLSKIRMGVPPLSRLDGGTPLPQSSTGWGSPPTPPSGDRSAKRALATRRAVCLFFPRVRVCKNLFLISWREIPVVFPVWKIKHPIARMFFYEVGNLFSLRILCN